jgi:hypothetical protein
MLSGRFSPLPELDSGTYVGRLCGILWGCMVSALHAADHGSNGPSVSGLASIF